MAAAVALVGVAVAVASAIGSKTHARSPVVRAAVTAFGLHGLMLVAQAALPRGYTPGVLTAPS
jgi:hypothetical protein